MKALIIAEEASTKSQRSPGTGEGHEVARLSDHTAADDGHVAATVVESQGQDPEVTDS